MITLGVLSDLPGIRHGFMTRAGGVSEGIYDSLNCGPIRRHGWWRPRMPAGAAPSAACCRRP
jgi:hypothetical protein